MAVLNTRFSLDGQDQRLAEAALRLAQRVNAESADPRYPGTAPRALVVGGFVRDVLLGQQPKDIDLEVYGVAPERLEALLEELFPHRVNTVGRSFGVLKVHLADDLDFDVSIPRRESKTGKGHKGFAVEGDPGMTVAEAAQRRDFTINAIAADPLTGELVDPTGGIGNLHNRILRVVDPQTFGDDPLRVWRAVQLTARLGLTVDAASMHLMREMTARGDLEELPLERVTEELKKLLLKTERPSKGFELARELGIVEKYLPELRVLIDTPQEPEWHPEGDVWIHTLMVLDQAARIIRDPKRSFTAEERLQVMLGALCHDLGKPSTTKRLEGRIRSLGHEEAGVEPARALLAHFAFPRTAVRAAEAVAKDHLKPVMLQRAAAKGELDDARYANAVRKTVKRVHPTSWRVLLAVAEADYRGRNVPGAGTGPYDAGEKFINAVETLGLDKEPILPLVQGRDLLHLGIKPGPVMGKIIRAIEDARDAGEVATRDQALRKAEEIFSRL